MITAEQIANKTKLELHTVRYRLGVLRRKNQITAERFGTTYAYQPNAIKQVKNFGNLKSGGGA